MAITYLITGGAGNIGGALALELLNNSNNHVVIFDNLSTGSLHKVPQSNRVTFIKGDVNVYDDISSVFSAYKFDYVFHYAALVGVKRTLNNPIGVLNDIEGIKHILALSKQSGVKRVFYSSSSEVYGEPFEIPQNENTTPLNSRLPYAIVKNVGEAFFKAYYDAYGLEYTIFRFFNTYGPNQSKDFVLPKFLNAALQSKDITIYGDGLQTRSFCYVDDNVQTCVNAIQNPSCINSVLNIGSDKEQTILSLAQDIIRITESSSKIVHLPALKEGDMTRRCPDISKMKTVLKRDLLPLEQGIKKMINFYESR